MKKIKTLLGIVCLVIFSGIAVAVEKVNINTANAETISTALKGIGPNKAQAIVEYREKNGAFESVEALAKVKGIGEKTVEENKDKISVSDE